MRWTRLTSLALLGLLGAAAVSAAQGETLEDGEMDATAPPPDEAFLEDDSSGDAVAGNETLADGEMDTTVPDADEAFLDEPVPGVDEAAPPPAQPAKPVPGPALALGLLGLAGAAALRRR
jgi:hypothetical protein